MTRMDDPNPRMFPKPARKPRLVPEERDPFGARRLWARLSAWRAERREARRCEASSVRTGTVVCCARPRGHAGFHLGPMQGGRWEAW